MLFQMLPIRAWVLVICACTRFAVAEEQMPGAAGDSHLVEVTFALDDKPATQDFHEVVTLWISERSRGRTCFVYNWAVQGGQGPDTNTAAKAAQCLKLMRAINQPKDLPESEDEIVTVRCRDGDKTLVKKFPMQKVPPEVHELLTIMGCKEAEFGRLKFVRKVAEPDGTANGSQPIRSETNSKPAAAGSHR